MSNKNVNIATLKSAVVAVAHYWQMSRVDDVCLFHIIENFDHPWKKIPFERCRF